MENDVKRKGDVFKDLLIASRAIGALTIFLALVLIYIGIYRTSQTSIFFYIIPVMVIIIGVICIANTFNYVKHSNIDSQEIFMHICLLLLLSFSMFGLIAAIDPLLLSF